MDSPNNIPKLFSQSYVFHESSDTGYPKTLFKGYGSYKSSLQVMEEGNYIWT